MKVKSRRGLRRRVDEEKIKAAIAAAERRTSGEIRVSVASFFWGPVRPVAERAFRRVGMAGTRDRNGILFFLVPARRRFVVLGDEGIHARVGQEFWDHLAAVMSEDFRKGDFSAGLLRGIEQAGERLAAYFPYDAATDRNELPDDIDFGR
jgi:uncharacterized membrane protein